MFCKRLLFYLQSEAAKTLLDFYTNSIAQNLFICQQIFFTVLENLICNKYILTYLQKNVFKNFFLFCFLFKIFYKKITAFLFRKYFVLQKFFNLLQKYLTQNRPTFYTIKI
jgi:hypothetical protein